jgi:outer membrane immunogenic protein
VTKTPKPITLGENAVAFACNQGCGNRMSKRLNRLALAATVGFAVDIIDVGVGRAADMAGNSPLKAVELYNWSGCYAGAYVGWAAENQWTATDLNGFAPGGVGQWNFSPGNEGIGGGTLGCNWQANNWLVLGIEGEGGFLHVEGSGPQPLIVVPPGGSFGSVSDTSRVGTGYGLVGGRVGLAFDRLLLYGKLGVAFFDSTAIITDANNPGFFATGRKFQSPFTVGGGAEYAIFDHWTGKFEYMFVDRGTSFNACDGAFCWKQDPSTTHIVKIGLNYKF